MGPFDNFTFSFTLDKSDAAPDPAASTVPRENSHAADDPPSEISPKTEVKPLPLTDSAAHLPEASCKGEKSDPKLDPSLDTPSRRKSRPFVFESGPDSFGGAPSGRPTKPLPSSKVDKDPTRESSSRKALQRRTSLSSSPGLVSNTNHTRAISAPPPVSRTTEKATFDPQPNGTPHEPLEEATNSASSSATPLGSEKLNQNNSTRNIRPMRKERNHPSVLSSVAITPLGTSPEPFFNYITASYAQRQQSSAKYSETVKFDIVRSDTGKTDAAKSDVVKSDTVKSDPVKPDTVKFELSDNEKKTERRKMDQLQDSDSLEAESILDRLLGLKYFEGAQSSLDQLSLILHLLQQRDLRSSPKALLATPEEIAHVQPSMLASTTDTGKPRSSKYTESAIAGSNVRIDKPVNKESGRPSSKPQGPKQSPLLPVPSSSQGRSASESAIPTDGKLFSDVPGLPTDVDTIIRYTPSKKDGNIEVDIDFISPEGNITLKKFTPWQLPKKYKGTTLLEHLQQEIQEPIKRTVQAGRRHHGRIYMYWVQGNFGLVKIGFTTRTVDKRLKEWHSKCKRTPHSINLTRGFLNALPLVRRLEHLIHAELRDKRVREPVCAGCGISHKEWFIVAHELAKQVTQRWCDWMQQCPYEKTCERFIKSPKKNTPVKVEEMWTLKQEHVDSLKAGKLLFKNGEESFRLSSLLEPAVPSPATPPPKLASRLSQLGTSHRPGTRKSSSAGRPSRFSG